MVSERSSEAVPGHPASNPHRFPTSWIGGYERGVHEVTFFTYYTPNTRAYTGSSNEFIHAACAASCHTGGVNAAYEERSVIPEKFAQKPKVIELHSGKNTIELNLDQ